MGRFALGLIVGLTIGITSSAIAAQIVGDTGYLMEWDITKEGETICSDPYAWPSIREIECN